MQTEPLVIALAGYEHQVAMGYLRDDLLSKINGGMSFQELERLIDRWEDQNSIYQGNLINPDFALLMQEGMDDGFLLYDVQNWTPVCPPDNLDADEENLKRIEEFTEIKSSRTELCTALRNVPYYPKAPTSRYIIVCIKTNQALMGLCTLNTEKYDADKMVFAQADLRTATDIEKNANELQFNFMAGLLYQGESVKVDNSVYESEPVAFDMWIYDTQTKEKVFTGNFMGDVTFSDRLGVSSDKPHGFVDSIYEEEKCRTHPKIIRSRKKLSV